MITELPHWLACTCAFTTKKKNLRLGFRLLDNYSMSSKARVFLPRTTFLEKIKGTERAARDSNLAQAGKIGDFYEWQMNRQDGNGLKPYFLLDGPPYANGKLHVGHAINKILKDFIVRSKVIADGCRVVFRPGWDCHGLPIELKIKKKATLLDNDEPLKIQEKAGALALRFIQSQMETFKKWGVSADWNSFYCTMDRQYIVNQLKIFATIYDNGYVFRSFKPVYWSPSSKTALAESELQYKDGYECKSVYFRFQVLNFKKEKIPELDDLPTSTAKNPVHIYALVWTTTPWNLPMNNAIAFSSSFNYVALEILGSKGHPIREIYLVASECVENLKKELGKEFKTFGSFEGSALHGLFYKSPINNELALPFLSSIRVKKHKGTGLVHCSYAHGFDDYNVALSNKDNVECFVDEEGRYTRHMGHLLEGKEVLSAETSLAVLEILKRNVLHVVDVVKSYPHDWRTDKPVLIRSSMQWFIDVSKIGKICAEKILSDEIKISCGNTRLREKMINQLVHRPFWCISRQRIWGVPIPYLVEKSSGEAKTSSDFIRFISNLVSKNDVKENCAHPTNLWLTMSVEDLLKHECCPKDFSTLCSADFIKGNDIMDVWMDSGVAWHTALPFENDWSQKLKSPFIDVVLEGRDQFEGWFQTSLLTSVAANGVVPFKKIVVHGMAHDDQGRKMSKSLGNVVSPEHVTDGSTQVSSLGVDGLRFWVASSSGSLETASIGENVLKGCEHKLYSIRRTLKYLLGVLDGMEKPGVAKRVANVKQLRTIDRYILLRLKQYLLSIQQKYKDFRFNSAITEFFDFLGNPLSSVYVTCLRDRLYCHRLGSQEHDAALFTYLIIGHRLVGSISVILPHLAVDFFQHHPLYKGQCELATRLTFEDLKLKDEWIGDEIQLNQIMDVVFQLQKSIKEAGLKIKLNTNREFEKKGVSVTVYDEEVFKVLAMLHRDYDSGSELLELLGVSYILLTKDKPLSDGMIWKIQVIEPPEDFSYCIRCRKMSRAKKNTDMCSRCLEAVVCC